MVGFDSDVDLATVQIARDLEGNPVTVSDMPSRYFALMSGPLRAWNARATTGTIEFITETAMRP